MKRIIALFLMFCFYFCYITPTSDEFIAVCKGNVEDDYITICNADADSYAMMNFDVARNGNIAIAFENDIIRIYDSQMECLNAFHVNYDGNYYVKWEDDAIWVYILRIETAFKLSIDGDILQTQHNIKYDELKESWPSIKNPTYVC